MMIDFFAQKARLTTWDTFVVRSRFKPPFDFKSPKFHADLAGSINRPKWYSITVDGPITMSEKIVSMFERIVLPSRSHLYLPNPALVYKANDVFSFRFEIFRRTMNHNQGPEFVNFFEELSF